MRSMKTAILLTGFGSGGQQGQRALLPFTQAVQAAFPDCALRWAFTSGLMRQRLAGARKKTDSAHKALCRLGFEKYQQVAIQPLQIIRGLENESLNNEIQAARLDGAPPRISVGAPLLDYEHNPASIERAALAFLRHLPPERQGREDKEAVVLAGHGSRHAADNNYSLLEQALQKYDRNIFVGTLAGEAALAGILQAVQERGLKKVWLVPMLSVVGKHTLRDIAGLEESGKGTPGAAEYGKGTPGALESGKGAGGKGAIGQQANGAEAGGQQANGPEAGQAAESWSAAFCRAGLECRTVVRGLVEYPAFIEIWLDNLRVALDQLA